MLSDVSLTRGSLVWAITIPQSALTGCQLPLPKGSLMSRLMPYLSTLNLHCSTRSSAYWYPNCLSHPRHIHQAILSLTLAGEVEGANDTAIATLNNVDILQAGTGQSVTIKGETLNENDYGTDNATRRTILNNNIVRYNANYNVTKVGQITFSITLPANNTIDEATIAESQGCLPNLSKLESADITNE